jgi:hypothetical protein
VRDFSLIRLQSITLSGRLLSVGSMPADQGHRSRR